MNKKKIILPALAIALVFLAVGKLSTKKVAAPQEESKKPIAVSVQKASDSKIITEKKTYPASVVGNQEVDITAKVAGTVTIAPREIGEQIGAGGLLAKIEDLGTLSANDQNLKSLQISQAQLASLQAKESYGLAKDEYAKLKNSTSSTSAERNDAETKRDIAKLQYENSLLGVTGSIDSHLILSPLSGIVTNKAVSVGDSVSAGQLLATISKNDAVKVQFFVDLAQRGFLTTGQKISALDGNGNSFNLIIKNIAVSAEQTTKRFLIEAYPEKQTTQKLLAGTIVTVSIENQLKPKADENILLPLSALSVGQNENYVFVFEDGIAKKQTVTIASVNGELAELVGTFSPETAIITQGNKLVRDGEAVVLQ